MVGHPGYPLCLRGKERLDEFGAIAKSFIVHMLLGREDEIQIPHQGCSPDAQRSHPEPGGLPGATGTMFKKGQE